MKRCLPILPMFLLILLNACGDITPAIGTAVAQTQTAVVWTPTITTIPDPHEAEIVTWLNTELLGVDPLQATLDATFHVLDVTFPPAPNPAYRMMRVDMRCDCSRNMQCCTAERMFVLVMLAMKEHGPNIIREVPNNVSEVKVVCHDGLALIGVMVAWWGDVRDYLGGQLTGDQLGTRVQRTMSP